MEGKVKWYNRVKGYGFIEAADGEYFVHHTALKDIRFLKDNDVVEFEAAETDKGKQAQNVVLKQKGSEVAGAPAKKAPMEEAADEEATEDDSEAE